MKHNLTITCDFDGTLFDPDWKLLRSGWYNLRTTLLLNKHRIPFILNTGRPHWDRFADLQLAIIGMKRPDVVIYGVGTKIIWRKGNRYTLDRSWNDGMVQSGWSKRTVVEKIKPIIQSYRATLFDTHNEFMTRIWVHRMPIDTVSRFVAEIAEVAPKTKVVLTEQILLPNTEVVFSGYLLLVPHHAGKDEAMRYVLNKLGSEHNIGFGDAFVDAPMLVDPTTEGYAVNPTALARKELGGTKVTILEGSPPANVLSVLRATISSPRNSPFRLISDAILRLFEPLVYPTLTPDELSLKGLELVQAGGFWTMIWGFVLDLFDGARARRNPHLTTKHGQLIDGYSDRMKEHTILMSHSKPDTALSCFLPSIARAQAEAVGTTVPEFDSSGGSALSRSSRLIRSELLRKLGNHDGSNRVDTSIFLSNMQTFQNRKKYSKSFSWAKLKTYDKLAVTRLLFYVDLLQKQLKTVKPLDQNLKNAMEEYKNVDVAKLAKSLSITFPELAN